MPFNPQELTPATVKGFVDRLHRFAKATDASAGPPKRSWSQEGIARALGFPSYHALQLVLESKAQPAPRSRKAWDFASPSGRPFFRVSDDWYLYRSSLTSFSVPDELWREPVLIQGDEQERRKMFSAIAEQAAAQGHPVLWVQGPWGLTASDQLQLDMFHTPYSLSPVFGYLLARESAAELLNMFSSMLGNNFHDSSNTMWKGRALNMLSAVLTALVYKRDHQKVSLTVEKLQESLGFDGFVLLAQDASLPAAMVQSLKAHLRALPGYVEAVWKQPDTVLDNHGFIQMQLAEVMGRLQAGDESLVFSPRHALALAESTDELPIFPTLLKAWVAEHPGGVLLLDGLSGGSSLLGWLPRAIPRLVEQGIRVVLGTRYLNDWAQTADTMQPLLSRFPNGFIMDSAADDPWVGRAAQAGWKTAEGRAQP